MDQTSGKPGAKIAAFLALTAAFSGVWFLLIVGQVGLPHSVLATGAMWSPGLAAICVRLGFQRNLRGVGWTLPAARWWALGLVAPIAFALPVYGLAWALGAGPHAESWIGQLPYGVKADGPGIALALLLTLGAFDRFARALGEEIGWRGLLFPELEKLVGFRKAALASSAIWAAWHLPLIAPWLIMQETPPGLYALACFVATLIGLGVLMAWLRSASRSLWPCVTLHGAHNLFVLAVMDAATTREGLGAWLLGEFGIGIAAMAWIAALIVLGAKHTAQARMKSKLQAVL